MDRHASIDATFTVLIRHLVLSFPQAAILSRSVGERYHVCVIVPYDGGPEKTVQVERAVCGESARSIKEFERILSELNLPTLFLTRDRYDVRSASLPGTEHAGGCPAANDNITSSRLYTSPANEGWPPAQIGGTVLHGPLDISGSSLPTHPGPLFPLCAD